jgi:hypothetical protein
MQLTKLLHRRLSLPTLYCNAIFKVNLQSNNKIQYLSYESASLTEVECL